MVVMVVAGYGHGGHGGSRLWSWRQQVVVMVVMMAAGCGHGGSRLWSWWQQVVVMRLRTDYNRLNAQMLRKMQLAPSPTCTCGLEDQRAELILQTMPPSADSKNKRVTNSSSATHQTLRQQGGTGEDGHIHLADWTLSVAAIEKKN